jgi:hypothetical protein
MAHVALPGLYNQALTPLRDIYICHKSRLDQKLGFLEIREIALVLQVISIGFLVRFK